MTAWILALVIQNAQAQALTTKTDYPTHYRASVGYVNGSISMAETVIATAYPTISHKLSRGFSPGHSGLDIDGNTGDSVLAYKGGVVEAISNTGPYGNKIIISHTNFPEPVSTLYAHLTDIFVTVGETVRAGQTIGTVGATGNANGDHLHFEVLLSGTAIEPEPFLTVIPK